MSKFLYHERVNTDEEPDECDFCHRPILPGAPFLSVQDAETDEEYHICFNQRECLTALAHSVPKEAG